MKVVRASFALVNPPEYLLVLKHLEAAARTCYKSEANITEDSAVAMMERLLRMEHHSVLEHTNISVRGIMDRAISHEWVRHRVGSAYSQESSRFCLYNKDQFGGQITCIAPVFWPGESPEYAEWYSTMVAAERSYMKLTSEMGATAQEARSVLPTSLKTEIFITHNIRQWLQFFNQRCAGAAHPQMREMSLGILEAFAARFPVFFKSVFEKFAPQYELFKNNNWHLAKQLPDELSIH